MSVGSDFHQPYPDPGEEFNHITFQLFQSAEATSATPGMQGFVEDYCAVLTALESEHWSGSPAQQSAAIMKCFAPASVPVLSALATDFAVFDHWFWFRARPGVIAPSGTQLLSWGWVNNPPAFDLGDPWNLDHWAASIAGRTLFDLLEPGNWRVYEDLIVPFTSGFNTGSWNKCLTGGGEDCFDFKKLGVRVPMVMVSDFIAKNTIVNSRMDHCSFLKTIAQKWGLPSGSTPGRRVSFHRGICGFGQD